MIKTIFLKTKLPTLNEYINMERSNKFIAAAAKKKYTNAILKEVKGLTFDPIKYDVAVTWYKDSNRKDHDNISFGLKFILDGMVKANVIPGDGSRYINSIHHHFELKDSGYYCMVEFIESID
jgi:hypothetical protein